MSTYKHRERSFFSLLPTSATKIVFMFFYSSPTTVETYPIIHILCAVVNIYEV